MVRFVGLYVYQLTMRALLLFRKPRSFPARSAENNQIGEFS
jgi:hypothetical protein